MHRLTPKQRPSKATYTMRGMFCLGLAYKSLLAVCSQLHDETNGSAEIATPQPPGGLLS